MSVFAAVVFVILSFFRSCSLSGRGPANEDAQFSYSSTVCVSASVLGTLGSQRAAAPFTLAVCTYSLSCVSAEVETDQAEVMVSRS